MKNTKTIAIAATAALALGASSAGAASFVTSAKIADGTIMNRDVHRGTISENRLDAGVRAKLNRAVSGARGAQGASGATGTSGATGAAGSAGQNGAAGTNGVNPARLVAASGDQGWSLTGAPAAKLTGGELRLAGGFDSSTTAGAIGISHSYDAPLSSLSALSYDAVVHARPNAVSAPTIHVTLTGAATGTASGFVNLVFEPANNGGVSVGERKSFDTIGGQWWATRDLAAGTPQAIARQATASLDTIKATSPNAKVVGISIDNGGSSADPIAVDALSMGADNLVVGFGVGFDRFDFGG